MSLTTFFPDYLEKLLTLSSFDEVSKKDLKSELTEGWLERSAQRIAKEFPYDTVEKLSKSLRTIADSPESNKDEKLREIFSSLFNDQQKQEKIAAIYSEEAEKILLEMTDTFVKNTDSQKQTELATALNELS